jgi:hypothetical protein
MIATFSSIVRSMLFYFGLARHAALDAASTLPARSRFGEGRALFFWIPAGFIPMKIGAGMTIIVKEFLAQYAIPIFHRILRG